MGKKTSLSFDQGLIQASQAALNAWSSQRRTHGLPAACKNDECNIEAVVRSSLNNGYTLYPYGGKKNCCSRFNSTRFVSMRQELKGSPSGAQISNPHPSLSNDIYATSTNKSLIVEIKIVSHSLNYMEYLMGNNINSDHVPPKNFHFTLPSPPGTTINKPIDYSLGYYSHLSEGQLWLDITRLSDAKNYFRVKYPSLPQTYELYLLLFSDTIVSIGATFQRLDDTLNVFNNTYPSLYHDYTDSNTLVKSFYKSDSLDFNYDYTILSSNQGIPGSTVEAFLVRIEP
jgi:hypothetical protein